MVIAATTAKTAMQIATTTQKTKSIRSASFDSLPGSQGIEDRDRGCGRSREQSDRDEPERLLPCAPRASLLNEPDSMPS